MAGHAFVSRFSPNRTAPQVLEAIFVQRHHLADTWLERLRDSILTDVKHHLLAVGPRGCGKSHLVALLVGRLRQDPALLEKVRIAWLPEDEITPSFWKFLLRILRALNAEYGAEIPPPPHTQIAEANTERRTSLLIDYLLEKLNGRVLLVVVENLDEVLRGLKMEGQRRWRAFLQEHPVATTLATTQGITNDLSKRDRPFFNFFQLEHLRSLSADEALELLQKIAGQMGNQGLLAFLRTPTGRARVRAIRHVAGGSHRVFIILSEFATAENMDDLVTAFEELLDELTPYYQERLRWLPDQQREIVELLCRQIRTMPVKEIAASLFLTEQTAAAQLKSLRDKGYVVSHSVGRESRYELGEPLMRLCIEVKNPQREPIRLIVEFLRVWYDQTTIASRLEGLPSDADLERLYFEAVLDECARNIPGPVDAALERDVAEARKSGDLEEVAKVLVDFVAMSTDSSKCIDCACELHQLLKHKEALVACERAIDITPKSVNAWCKKIQILTDIGKLEDVLAACERAAELIPDDFVALLLKSTVLSKSGDPKAALVSLDRAIASPLAEEYRSTLLTLRSRILLQLGHRAEAAALLDTAIELDPLNPFPLVQKGVLLREQGSLAKALTALDRALQLKPVDLAARKIRACMRFDAGRFEGAVDDFQCILDQSPRDTESTYGMAQACLLQGKWDDAAHVLKRRLHSFKQASTLAEDAPHLGVLIAVMFRSSAEPTVWRDRVHQLALILKQIPVEQTLKTNRAHDGTISSDPGQKSALPIITLGMSLVISLSDASYSSAGPESLEAWATIWAELVDRYPELSLSLRVFQAGIRYLQTRDERVAFDLVEEERSLLQSVLKLKSPLQVTVRLLD